MASSVFNEQQFENKLVNLKDSQEAINSLSSWCLQNKDHHKKIVNCWLHCLKRVKIEQRLSLFYLANDVIQYSKRKHYQFVESWGTALQKATTLVRDDKVKSRIMRIFKIWDERGVYDEAFISDLCGLLTTNVKKKTETNLDSSEFQPSILIAKIQECKILENDTDIRFKKVKENSLHLTDADNMLSSLKDRRHGSDVVAEVDAGVKKMEAYVKALELEIAEREKLIDFLHQATLFYESQRGEAKIVSNAYRNFGNKVKLLKRKLDDLMPTLSDSPIPSPDVNAPSPSPDSDFELPGNEKFKKINIEKNTSNLTDNSGLNFSFVNNTFMGNSRFSDINLQRDVFNDAIQPLQMLNSSCGGSKICNDNVQNEITVRPIEVINTREQKGDVGFSITDFIKSLLPTGHSKPEETSNTLQSQHQNLEPLQPPPMPPLFSTNDTFSMNWKLDWGQTENPDVSTPWSHESANHNWIVSGRMQDSYFEQETQALNTDTPESPPLYEKKGVSQPVEYDDSLPTAPLLDVDHRTLLPLSEVRDMDHRIEMSHRIDIDHRKLSKTSPKDVDHRNLISLTGSPGNETKPLPPPPAFVWPEDQDYRCKVSDTDFRIPRRSNDFSDVLSKYNAPQQPYKVSSGEAIERKDVNVESIDMDVSEEDEEETGVLIQMDDDADSKNTDSSNSFFIVQSNNNNNNNNNNNINFNDNENNNNINDNENNGNNNDNNQNNSSRNNNNNNSNNKFGNNNNKNNNSKHFNVSSTFIDSVGSTLPTNADVDERLKSIFGEVFPVGNMPKLTTLAETSSMLPDNQLPHIASEMGQKNNGNEMPNHEALMQGIEPNSFDNDYCRPEMMWLGDNQGEQVLSACSPNISLRGMNFTARTGRNLSRPLRGGFQHRFLFRPHHPRADAIRGRMPFRPRLPSPVRGGRW